MAWEVEYTDEFEAWWNDLDSELQVSIDASVGLLIVLGPKLPFPHSSGIQRSKHSRMRELRVQHGGDPYRILYAFDPRRTAILLLGGSKVGDDRWYETHVPVADSLYDQHLDALREEALIE
jgi:hypothetical protein